MSAESSVDGAKPQLTSTPGCASTKEAGISDQEAPASPKIIITGEGGHVSSAESAKSKVKRRETLNKVKRTDSLSRTKSFSATRYELSPELRDRSVRLLERQYGGKEKANAAATVIQMHYRKYSMKKRFKRMRTYSSPGIELKPRQASLSDPNRGHAGIVQTTPVIKIQTSQPPEERNQRVRSILIIDNINSPSGSFYSQTTQPVELSSVRRNLEERLEEAAKKDIDGGPDDATDGGAAPGRQGSVTSETEHYVKVEFVEDLSAPADEQSSSELEVPNGDVRPAAGDESELDSGTVCLH